MSRNVGKHKADTPTKAAGGKKFYCNMHGCNKTHNNEDCFKLKQRTKSAKKRQDAKRRRKSDP
eukprot:9705517-Ditylum_brightwellii.AAC.2